MKKIFSLLFVVLFYFGCGSISEIGTEKTVEKSPTNSDWILIPTSESEGNIYFTGQMTKAKDRSFGLKQAYADGMMNLMNSMQNSVRSQSSMSLRGSNVEEEDIGRFSEFAVGWISENRTISGLQNSENYWEKIEKKTETGVTYFYNCYSLLKISKTDYNKALIGAYENMKKKSIELNNKKAEETANKLIDDLKKNP